MLEYKMQNCVTEVRCGIKSELYARGLRYRRIMSGQGSAILLGQLISALTSTSG